MAALFPVQVRYTGASLAFNLAGIVGASLAPYIATRLAAILMTAEKLDAGDA